jgi:hypothetical protein
VKRILVPAYRSEGADGREINLLKGPLSLLPRAAESLNIWRCLPLKLIEVFAAPGHMDAMAAIAKQFGVLSFWKEPAKCKFFRSLSDRGPAGKAVGLDR